MRRRWRRVAEAERGVWYAERLAGDIIRRPRWVSEARGGWRRCTGDAHPPLPPSTTRKEGWETPGMGQPGNEKKRRRAQRDIARQIRPGKRHRREKKAQFSRASRPHPPVISPDRQRGINPSSSLAAKKGHVVRPAPAASFSFCCPSLRLF